MSAAETPMQSRRVADEHRCSVDLYLSEMSVSDRHGGGLTLQRVLGADLEQVRLFAHVSRFAADMPPSERFTARGLDLPLWTETDSVRRIIGCRAGCHLSRLGVVRRAHARWAAARIASHFAGSKQVLRGLVCPQGVASLYTAEALSQMRPFHYVTWMMDDHLVRWHGDCWHYPPHIEELLARHLRRARAVFVISPTMGQYFRERFGIDSTVLFGPADVREEPRWETPRGDGGLRLGYFGAVEQWQLDALRLLADCLEPANAQLDIYTASVPDSKALRGSGVRFRERLQPGEIAAAMRDYDAVVLPASFDPAMRHITELSLATKMSECLASGTVSLLIAPPYAAMARYLAGTSAAVVVTEKSAASMGDALVRLRNPAERIAILQAARDLVKARLTTPVMRDIWMAGAARLN
jgi:glycosyltransferase involved in cell wall biosynthesis